jgi:hypothetical protein
VAIMNGGEETSVEKRKACRARGNIRDFALHCQHRNLHQVGPHPEVRRAWTLIVTQYNENRHKIVISSAGTRKEC